MPPAFRPVLLSAAVLVGTSACVTSSSSRIPPGAVVLRFAWPQTLSARVSHSVFNGDARGERLYWWSLEPGEGAAPRRLGVEPGASPEAGLAALAHPEMSVRFDAQGTFVGAEPPADSAGQAMLEAFPLEPEQREHLLRTLRASQEEAARVRWEQRVGHWRDVMLLSGETVRFATKMWVGEDSLQREEVEAEERTTFEAGVACVPEQGDTRCVRLRVETTPLHALHEDDPCERVHARRTFELVTDPQTLLPYLTRAVQEDERAWCEADGTQGTERTRQGEVFVFTYGLQPLPPGTWTRREPGSGPARSHARP